MNKFLAGTILVSCFIGCAGVRVKTHHGFMGPDVFEATDGKVSVSYYNGNCCCVAEKVLESLAAQANNKTLDWSKMADYKFRDKILAEECRKVKGFPGIDALYRRKDVCNDQQAAILDVLSLEYATKHTECRDLDKQIQKMRNAGDE